MTLFDVSHKRTLILADLVAVLPFALHLALVEPNTIPLQLFLFVTLRVIEEGVVKSQSLLLSHHRVIFLKTENARIHVFVLVQNVSVVVSKISTLREYIQRVARHRPQEVGEIRVVGDGADRRQRGRHVKIRKVTIPETFRKVRVIEIRVFVGVDVREVALVEIFQNFLLQRYPVGRGSGGGVVEGRVELLHQVGLALGKVVETRGHHRGVVHIAPLTARLILLLLRDERTHVLQKVACW